MITMSEAELILVNEAKNCTLYTIHFLSKDDTEFEEFFNKFKDDVEFNPDLMRIVGFLGKVADFDKILILGNGGVKNTKTYEESKELSGYVLTLQNFDRLVKEGVKDGTITVSENRIETDKTFDL